MVKYTVEYLAGLNKGQLRELCRANGVSYNGLNNAGMQEALATVPGDVDGVVEGGDKPETAGAVSGHALETDTTPVRAPRVLPDLTAKAPVEPVAKPAKERKIQANRPEQHGVKRPSEGTICAQIWTWCDEVQKAGDKVTAKELRAALPELDDTTKTVQFYRWRKFNGIEGRS